MAMKINLGSKPKGKSTARPKASTGPKRSRGTTKAAPKRSTGRKTSTPARQPAQPKVDPKVLKEHTKALERAGARHRGAREELDEAINEVYEVVSAAQAAGVGMSLIERTVGVSRQWLYKMGNSSKRNGNGNKPAAKRSRSAAKAKTSANGKSRTTTRKRGSTAKGTRPKIKIGK
jgi:hypothetical protein